MNRRSFLKLGLACPALVSLMCGCGGQTDTETTTEETPALRVGMECAYAPFNWTQDEPTTPDGSKAVPIYGSDYYAYGSNSKNLYDAKDDGTMRGQADWGYNAISNGGNAENIGWRTLTKEEWAYIINSRSGDYRYAKGTVHNKNGFIIFPDGFTLPEGISITNANTSDAGYTSYSDDDWAALETNGCVFLPATGMRNRTSVYETGSVGNYWSSSYMNNDRVYNIRFDGSSLKIENDGDRQNGFPVRLVKASLDQDNGGYYLIGCVQDWKDFATLVETTPMANAKMTADIDLGTDQTMLGSIEQPYSGTFDGQGFSLTVQLNSTLDGVAPFRRIDNTTIKNLAVAGTITGGIHCSGLVGGVPENSEYNLISNVMVSATITTTGSHCGGILGHGGSTLNTTIQDCLFNGTINGRDGGSTVGVIWGWQTYGNSNITSCLENGTYTNCSSFDPVFMAYSAGAVINSTYYVTGNSTNGTQATTTTLSDGTVTSGLNADRTGDEAPWIQDPVTNLPMLKSFVSKNSGISTGEAIQVHSSKFIVQSESWYSISGQKLSGKPTAKGIYIRDGKKIIVK